MMDALVRFPARAMRGSRKRQVAALEATAAPNATRATLVERSTLTAADASHMSLELQYLGRTVLPATNLLLCGTRLLKAAPVPHPAFQLFRIWGSKSHGSLGCAIALTTY